MNQLRCSLLPSNVDAMIFLAENKLSSSTTTALVKVVLSPNEAKSRAKEEKEEEEEGNPPLSALSVSEDSDQDRALFDIIAHDLVGLC